MLVAALLWAWPAFSAAETPDAASNAEADAAHPAPGVEAAPGAVDVAPGHEAPPASATDAAAHAAESHIATSHGAETHAAGEEAHTSPNLFTVELGLMVWTIVTFLVVLLILRATAWKPLMAALAEREQKIEGAIAEASRIKNEAEQLFAKYQTMIDRAKDESRSILDEARKDGLALQEDIKNRAKQEAEEFKSRAQREIELQKEAAIKEIWDQTAGLSTLLASKVLGRTLQGADQDRLVKELLVGLQSDVAAESGGGRRGERAS